jgi:hypothetical protein
MGLRQTEHIPNHPRINCTGRYKSNYHTNTNMTAQRGTNGTNKVYKISYKSTHWFIIIRTFSDIFLILVHLGEVYSIQHYVIKFVSDLRQVDGFLRVFLFPPPVKLTVMI